jgi:hypothetical protein
MDNQHRKITGYRELNEEEISLMNEVKELGIQMEGVLEKVEVHIKDQYTPEFTTECMLRHDNATPQRFLALAKTEFQTGLMYATRAVAQPEFF